MKPRTYASDDLREKIVKCFLKDHDNTARAISEKLSTTKDIVTKTITMYLAGKKNYYVPKKEISRHD